MILILGVTASGKGKLAFALAKSLGAEIISIDSMKVYRRMDIGTAKPPKENRDQIPYHLIDVVEPSDSFSVARFLELAQAASNLYKTSLPVEKRDFVQKLTSNLGVDRKNVAVELKNGARMIANRPLVTSGRPHEGTHRTWQAILKKLLTMFAEGEESQPQPL